MPDQLTISESDQESLDLGILNHFEADEPKEVFLKLQKMGEKKRELIFIELDNVEDLLLTEQTRLMRSILGDKLPRWPQERWHVVRIISESVTTYESDNQKIIEAINLATGRNFVAFKKTVDWTKFAQTAQKLLNALEVLYEVKSYPLVQMALLLLHSFYNTVNNLDQLSAILKKVLLALDALNTRRNAPFDKEKFLKELLPEFYPIEPLPAEVKQALSVFGFLPPYESERLSDPINIDECNSVILASSQALTVLQNNWNRLGQKPTNFNLLIDDLRAEVKFTSKLTDLVSWLADKKISEKDSRSQTSNL